MLRIKYNCSNEYMGDRPNNSHYMYDMKYYNNACAKARYENSWDTWVRANKNKDPNEYKPRPRKGPYYLYEYIFENGKVYTGLTNLSKKKKESMRSFFTDMQNLMDSNLDREYTLLGTFEDRDSGLEAERARIIENIKENKDIINVHNIYDSFNKKRRDW